MSLSPWFVFSAAAPRRPAPGISHEDPVPALPLLPPLSPGRCRKPPSMQTKRGILFLWEMPLPCQTPREMFLSSSLLQKYMGLMP
ncbi:uncharacterized protein LOC118165126 isoform X5 [Oxyura jamaicensis]|uniref:uncharacterized protein LOC118165126 isoform X5 n=1 Tax=Oxyura jamaicensis TaxID=8884 RepID=UPI0015A5175D|nr:uncharacterized protein LOC118165126 isoform X5 [Oxyura jamaicensis]